MKISHAVYKNRTHTRNRSKFRHKRRNATQGQKQAQRAKVHRKQTPRKQPKNLIHHRNPGPNIRTPYEDQPLAKKITQPCRTPERPPEDHLEPKKTAAQILIDF